MQLAAHWQLPETHDSPKLQGSGPPQPPPLVPLGEAQTPFWHARPEQQDCGVQLWPRTAQPPPVVPPLLLDEVPWQPSGLVQPPVELPPVLPPPFPPASKAQLPARQAKPLQQSVLVVHFALAEPQVAVPPGGELEQAAKAKAPMASRKCFMADSAVERRAGEQASGPAPCRLWDVNASEASTRVCAG